MQEEVTTLLGALREYGPLGMVLAYCLYTDWTSRKDARKSELARIDREIERERIARKREDDCIARIQALEARHAQELTKVAERSSRAIEALTKALGKAGTNNDETVALDRVTIHAPR